jgi:protein-tyrosine phosphatase
VVRICFVCLGNICRSPTAEAVMRHLVAAERLAEQIVVESAGTGDWHVGHPRDKRSRAVGEARGIPLTGVARQFVPGDFDRYTHVIAMDRANRDELLKMTRGPQDRAKVALLRSFDQTGTLKGFLEPPTTTPLGEAELRQRDLTAPTEAEVPDPYYGGAKGFDEVFDICDRACRGLLAQLRREAGV